jgi:RNA polymerase sigma factor (sigma-70 family)
MGVKSLDFERIYRLYFHDVLLYMRGLSANESIAEEITQETFVKALKAIDTFDGSRDIRAWLFTIAKNSYYTYCKRQKIYTGAEPPEGTPDIQIDFAQQFSNAETALLIHRFLHTMEEPYKEVFNLRVFGELPFEKIGLIFGKSPGWARVTFYRAKMQILAHMEAMEHDKN